MKRKSNIPKTKKDWKRLEEINRDMEALTLMSFTLQEVENAISDFQSSILRRRLKAIPNDLRFKYVNFVINETQLRNSLYELIKSIWSSQFTESAADCMVVMIREHIYSMIETYWPDVLMMEGEQI